jgi:hypothetical protein
MFVANCVGTDPCLSQIVWTQIPVCHNLCGHRSLVANRDLCPHNLWQAGICVHTGCDKQGSVSTQLVTNRDLCPHSLWQTRDPCLSQAARTQIPVYHKLCKHRSLFVINCVDIDPCLSQIVWAQIPVCHKLCGHRSLFVTTCGLW